MRKKPSKNKLPCANPRMAPDVRNRSRKKARRVVTSNLPLHDLFAQQAAAILDSVDIGEEEKQMLLVGMSCPCCGAGGLSFSVKLDHALGTKPRFVAD